MQDKALIHHDAVRITAISDATEVLIGKVVGECHIRTELLEAGLALGAGTIGIDHAAHGGQVAGLEPRDRRAGPRDTTDDLMAWHAGVHRRHHAAPLITDLVQIGVADPAE
jgi:hypothetical protein